jgi:16S rRNA (cytidine1402-2'-O)-methyltransferase
MSGTLFVVATPIGNLEDITVRALRILREVSVIAAEDTRHTARLLARHAISTPTTSLHEHNEAGKSPALIARLGRGESIALVSDAGTPTISDPGGRLIRDTIAAGIRVEPIPGASAVLAALAVAGAPTDMFSFHGFPPIRAKDRTWWFDRLRRVGGTVVFFEAPHRIRRTLETLLERVGDCQVVIARELTKIHEELVRGPISEVLSRIPAPRGEFTIVAEIGYITDIGPPMPLDEGNSKRTTIAALARSYGVSTNQVYRALEALRISGN